MRDNGVILITKARYGTARSGIDDTVRYGTVWYGTVRYGAGTVRCWYGRVCPCAYTLCMVRYGRVWYGAGTGRCRYGMVPVRNGAVYGTAWSMRSSGVFFSRLCMLRRAPRPMSAWRRQAVRGEIMAR